jgi:hypothetical protein
MAQLLFTWVACEVSRGVKESGVKESGVKERCVSGPALSQRA